MRNEAAGCLCRLQPADAIAMHQLIKQPNRTLLCRPTEQIEATGKQLLQQRLLQAQAMQVRHHRCRMLQHTLLPPRVGQLAHFLAKRSG